MVWVPGIRAPPPPNGIGSETLVFCSIGACCRKIISYAACFSAHGFLQHRRCAETFYWMLVALQQMPCCSAGVRCMMLCKTIAKHLGKTYPKTCKNPKPQVQKIHQKIHQKMIVFQWFSMEIRFKTLAKRMHKHKKTTPNHHIHNHRGGEKADLF